MKRLKFSTLRGRLTFLIVISIVTIFLIRISYLTLSQNNYYSNLWSENLNQQLNLGVSALKAPLWDFNLSNLDDIVSAFFIDPTVVQVIITDSNDTLIMNKQVSIFPNPHDIITNHKRIFNKDQWIGTLSISISTQLYKTQLMRDLAIELITTLFLILIIFMIVNKIASYILKPIDQLLSVSESIASGNLSVQFTTKSTNEFGLLETSIEKMQVQLQSDLNKMEKDFCRHRRRQ